MSKSVKHTGTLKEKAKREMIEFFLLFLYLALVFGTFLTYKRLVLAGVDVDYRDYGLAIIKALVLAKVMLVARDLNFASRYEDKPLIYPTLYKTFCFYLLMIFFTFLEAIIVGFFHGRGMAQSIKEVFSIGWPELLSRNLILLVSFIPFFAFEEISRVLGEGKMFELFFRTGAPGAAMRIGEEARG